MTDTKHCPECQQQKTKSEMQNCGLGSCDTILCNDCQNDHVLCYHNDPRPLEDDEWEDLE